MWEGQSFVAVVLSHGCQGREGPGRQENLITLCSDSCSPTLCSSSLVRSRLAGFQCPPACGPVVLVHSASGYFSSPSLPVHLCTAAGLRPTSPVT